MKMRINLDCALVRQLDVGIFEAQVFGNRVTTGRHEDFISRNALLVPPALRT